MLRKTTRHLLPPFVVSLALASLLAAAAPAPQSSSDPLVNLAREAVARYAKDAAMLLADERCEQKAFENRQDVKISGFLLHPRGRRRWQAEIALVPTPELAAGGYPWIEFRDVASLDGRPAKDREERLSQLFRRESPLTIERATEIAAANARFNLGRARNINTPSMPLLVLHSTNQRRFAFRRAAEEQIGGARAVKLAFREVARPTLVRASGRDCFASGALWIDPSTGDVVRAQLRCDTADSSTGIITVRYSKDDRFGLHLAVEMSERPAEGSLEIGMVWVEADCRYSNYRRFETSGRLILKQP